MYGDNDLYQFNESCKSNLCLVSIEISQWEMQNVCAALLLLANGVAALESHMIIESHDFVLAKMTASATASIYLCTVFIVLFNVYVDSQDTDAQVRRFAKWLWWNNTYMLQ